MSKRLSDEVTREMKFKALHLILEKLQDTYLTLTDARQQSFFEVGIGALIFYLPRIQQEHFSGYISVAAMNGYLNGQRKVKDHIYPRKQAAAELLRSTLSLEELKKKYHTEMARYMYVTSAENSSLVNYFENHEDHDEALSALQIEKFPLHNQERFQSEKELAQFKKYVIGKNIQQADARQLADLLDEFRRPVQ